MNSTNKLDWHNQEINRLLKIIFNPDSDLPVLERIITRAEEADLLLRFNKTIQSIAKREKINPTLFFSKKAQKDFLRLIFKEGIELASKEITPWRSQLIMEDVLNLLK